MFIKFKLNSLFRLAQACLAVNLGDKLIFDKLSCRTNKEKAEIKKQFKKLIKKQKRKGIESIRPFLNQVDYHPYWKIRELRKEAYKLTTIVITVKQEMLNIDEDLFELVRLEQYLVNSALVPMPALVTLKDGRSIKNNVIVYRQPNGRHQYGYGAI